MSKKIPNLKAYFSDFFGIDPKLIEEYGAFNISLLNDIPLFIDLFYFSIVRKSSIKNYIKILLIIYYF